MIAEAIDRIVVMTKTAFDRPIEIDGRTYWQNKRVKKLGIAVIG